MIESARSKLITAEKYFVLFIIISFVGWLAETALCSLEAGRYCDRGFLTLPFCTIYGFTILILYALLGTPTEGGLLLKNMNNRRVRLPVYFLLSALIATTAELVTAVFFEQVCKISLWDYSAYRFNYKGYICLEFFLIWGVLIVFSMKYLFIPMRTAVGTIPEKVLFWISGSLTVLLVADWIVHYAQVFMG